MHLTMVHVGLHYNLKAGLRTEYMTTATKIEDFMVNTHEQKFAYDKLYIKITDYSKWLNNFG